uniref:Chloroplast-like protein n=1 Tax=Tetraselmis sp. GSL018 TaxID=582737 RepID=A0A061SBI6_9CHLO
MQPSYTRLVLIVGAGCHLRPSPWPPQDCALLLCSAESLVPPSPPSSPFRTRLSALESIPEPWLPPSSVRGPRSSSPPLPHLLSLPLCPSGSLAMGSVSRGTDAAHRLADSCPVSCIHWVEKEELPALEYVMQKMDRVNVSAMMGQGTAVGDVFDAAQRFVKDRREREERMAKARAYSPAQEAARQAAAEEIMRQNLGWFAGAMRGFMGMANDVVAGSPGSRTGGGERVGERKRSRRQTDGPGSAVGENGATIPPERALVPVGAKADRTGGR